MPPLNIDEMKRRRLKRDKQQCVVRQEELEENEAKYEAAKVRSTNRALCMRHPHAFPPQIIACRRQPLLLQRASAESRGSFWARQE